MGAPVGSVWAGASGSGCPETGGTGVRVVVFAAAAEEEEAAVGFAAAGLDAVVEGLVAVELAAPAAREAVVEAYGLGVEADTNVLDGLETNRSCRIAMRSGVVA